MGESLKPCPFCGGDAEMDTRQAYRNIVTGAVEDLCSISCRDCGAQHCFCYRDAPGQDREDIIALVVDAWNHRDTPAEESSEQVGWRPIETADPEDGKCILVATADTPPSVGEAWWRMNYEDKLELWWAGTSNGDYYADPISQCNQPVTHWMPLPQPPASDVGSAYPTERAK